MIYVTGDCHGFYARFKKEHFPEQVSMTRDDYVIICGDFGIWNGDEEELLWMDFLRQLPFTILFVDGNHENFDRLYGDEFEEVDFHGGRAHRITDNVYHLMRGHVFDLCGKKFFAFGGASSHDIDDGILDEKDFATRSEFETVIQRYQWDRKLFRINHISWWEQELPSEEEMALGVRNLEENGNKVDFIISHCCPQYVAAVFSRGRYKPDRLTTYFNTIAETVDFDKWFFGHYHNNQIIMNKFVMIYEQIFRIV